MKDRVFRSSLDGSPPTGQPSWFALGTDDPSSLAAHLRDASVADIREHFVRGDFETWLREFYARPDLADAVRRLRNSWSGSYVPRSELIALLESKLGRVS